MNTAEIVIREVQRDGGLQVASGYCNGVELEFVRVYRNRCCHSASEDPQGLSPSLSLARAGAGGGGGVAEFFPKGTTPPLV
jgi:hypothetical protein